MKHLETYDLDYISGKEKVKISEKSEQTLSKISEGMNQMNQCTSICICLPMATDTFHETIRISMKTTPDDKFHIKA